MAPDELQGIDTRLREAISRCCNVQLSDDAWTQASLPLCLGGIGTRRMADVALPAYISSMDATRELVCQINLCENDNAPVLQLSSMEDFKNQQCPNFKIDPDTSLTQCHLDEESSTARSNDLLSRANQVDRARLLAEHPHTVAPGYPPYLLSASACWCLTMLCI
ncbi:hypothetical protein Pcinc_009229 [Petrolisthes cinctipes]|uniref:Uncharacterized protein n=1 Tax=Petrolisthes cinctipes TaxID=88211 RepID=A0AAE1KUZ1_PETCI|nr:hypothetical protein Pcinc_009229 [Petrolisthes cinctipes]